MPWTANDAYRFTHKADTPGKQTLWARIANSALKRFLNMGYSQKHAEARAIREANAVIYEKGR